MPLAFQNIVVLGKLSLKKSLQATVLGSEKIKGVGDGGEGRGGGRSAVCG